MMDQAGDISTAEEQQVDTVIDETSATFVARWNHLVSTTNWEKGRIISQWRAALIAASASAQEYSDEAWSRRLQSVTPQHVGRLRRVWERFGEVQADYERLYWSHFQAALDWSDAELWLEGAVQNNWSISEMRGQRATMIAATTGEAPADEIDADVALDHPSAEPADSMADEDHDGAVARDTSDNAISPVSSEMDDLGDESSDDSSESSAEGGGWDEASEASAYDDEEPAAEPVRPFASLAELPADLADAFESFKLAILRHKLAGWSEISREDVLGVLDSLKGLALAPSA